MKVKHALLGVTFCLLLAGCQDKSTSVGASSNKSIHLDKDYCWNIANKKYEKEILGDVTDSDDIKTIESALNKVIIPKESPDLTGNDHYGVTIMKGDGKKAGYTLYKLSEDEYFVVTSGPIDTEKQWCIKDVDLKLEGVFKKYLKENP